MKIRLVKILTLGIFGICLLCGHGFGQTSKKYVTPEDEAALRKWVRDGIDAFNNRTPRPIPDFYTLDADFVNILGMRSTGAENIDKGLKQRRATALKNAKLTLLDFSIRFIRPDVAIVYERHNMTGFVNEAGETVPVQQELSIRVFVKEKGKWLISAFHNTLVKYPK